MLDNGADNLHMDVMDSMFVRKLIFGHPVDKCLRNKPTCGLEGFFMVVNYIYVVSSLRMTI